MPEYKETECRICKTKTAKLFARNPMRDGEDFFCKVCMDEGLHLQDI